MIGLFFGDTEFPIKILKKIKKLKKKYFIIDLSQNRKFKNDKNSYSISIGQFGKIINLIKVQKCNKVLFAGKINKPKFSSLKLSSCSFSKFNNIFFWKSFLFLGFIYKKLKQKNIQAKS
jgi:DUF1009 family protein